MTVKNLATGLAITMALAACGSDGSSDQDFRTGCTVDGQCATGRCLTGGNFPGGLCTRACSSSAGCPSGWSCISNSSGVCMRNCATNVDCASLGTQYECNAESLEGSSGGQQRVCRGR
jgi:hypothetical protein